MQFEIYWKQKKKHNFLQLEVGEHCIAPEVAMQVFIVATKRKKDIARETMQLCQEHMEIWEELHDYS